MSACEKCWDDAYMAMLSRGGSQAEHYARLLRERANDVEHVAIAAAYMDKRRKEEA